MRPNVDIPWSIHGQIKEHAERTDKTIEEAYIETLEHGVSELPDHRKEMRLPSPDYNDFGPRLIRTQGEESHHINNSLTFQPLFHLTEDARVFRTTSSNMTADDFIGRLANLNNVGRLDREWFTVHQLGGALVGRGAANFASALREAPGRFASEDIPLYKNGHFIYFAHLAYEGEYLLIRGEIPRLEKENTFLSNVELRFITDGVPVTGSLYQRLARAMGFNELHNASPLSLAQTGYRVEEPTEPAVVDRITTDEEGYDDPSVTGLIVENPLQGNDGLLDYLKQEVDDGEQQGDASKSVSDAKTNIDVLANYDEVYCGLTHNHGAEKDREYDVKGLSATYIQSLFNRNSTWNLTIDVEW